MKSTKFQTPNSRESSSTKHHLGGTPSLNQARRPWSLRLGASLVIGVWCLALLFCHSSNAQSYSINWYKISGGGGTSTNGQYSVSGTIGQPDASTAMTGGNYSLTGGFWALYAVQVPGAPVLTITRSGNSA